MKAEIVGIVARVLERSEKDRAATHGRAIGRVVAVNVYGISTTTI